MQANRSRNSILFLTTLFILLAASSCAPPRSVQQGTDQLELTDEMIRERLNGAFVRDIPEETGAGQTINWRFFESEPKEVTIVDKKVEGATAEVILEIKTRSSPRSKEQRTLSGRIKTMWAIETGMVLRQWQIIETENISLKYKNLSVQGESNSNSPTR
ncbi:MAG: hypothetical protein QM785_12750 [Pyrinomonadaceae bacterium]